MFQLIAYNTHFFRILGLKEVKKYLSLLLNVLVNVELSINTENSEKTNTLSDMLKYFLYRNI